MTLAPCILLPGVNYLNHNYNGQLFLTHPCSI